MFSSFRQGLPLNTVQCDFGRHSPGTSGNRSFSSHISFPSGKASCRLCYATPTALAQRSKSPAAWKAEALAPKLLLCLNLERCATRSAEFLKHRIPENTARRPETLDVFVHRVKTCHRGACKKTTERGMTNDNLQCGTSHCFCTQNGVNSESQPPMWTERQGAPSTFAIQHSPKRDHLRTADRNFVGEEPCTVESRRALSCDISGPRRRGAQHTYVVHAKDIRTCRRTPARRTRGRWALDNGHSPRDTVRAAWHA